MNVNMEPVLRFMNRGAGISDENHFENCFDKYLRGNKFQFIEELRSLYAHVLYQAVLRVRRGYPELLALMEQKLVHDMGFNDEREKTIHRAGIDYLSINLQPSPLRVLEKDKAVFNHLLTEHPNAKLLVDGIFKHFELWRKNPNPGLFKVFYLADLLCLEGKLGMVAMQQELANKLSDISENTSKNDFEKLMGDYLSDQHPLMQLFLVLHFESHKDAALAGDQRSRADLIIAYQIARYLPESMRDRISTPVPLMVAFHLESLEKVYQIHYESYQEQVSYQDKVHKIKCPKAFSTVVSPYLSSFAITLINYCEGLAKGMLAGHSYSTRGLAFFVLDAIRACADKDLKKALAFEQSEKVTIEEEIQDGLPRSSFWVAEVPTFERLHDTGIDAQQALEKIVDSFDLL